MYLIHFIPVFHFYFLLTIRHRRMSSCVFCFPVLPFRRTVCLFVCFPVPSKRCYYILCYHVCMNPCECSSMTLDGLFSSIACFLHALFSFSLPSSSSMPLTLWLFFFLVWLWTLLGRTAFFIHRSFLPLKPHFMCSSSWYTGTGSPFGSLRLFVVHPYNYPLILIRSQLRSESRCWQLFEALVRQKRGAPSETGLWRNHCRSLVPSCGGIVRYVRIVLLLLICDFKKPLPLINAHFFSP